MSSPHQVPELIGSLTGLMESLTFPVHEVWFPFPKLAVIHALRVSVVWASLTRRRQSPQNGLVPGTKTRNLRAGDGEKVGVLGDLFGYLVMCWGGSTIVSILQSQPPPWLIAPQIWAVYITIYLLTLPTGLSTLISRVPGTNLLGSWVDGLTRGNTVSLISSNPRQTTVGRLVLSIIGTGGGGWIVQLFGLDKENWELGIPGVLRPEVGILGTMDIWAAGLGSLVYSTLTSSSTSSSTKDSNDSSYLLSALLSTSKRGRYLSNEFQKLVTGSGSGSGFGLSDPKYAKSVVVAIMASLFFARVITLLLSSSTRATFNAHKKRNKNKNRVKNSTSTNTRTRVGEEIDSLVREIEAKEHKLAERIKGTTTTAAAAAGGGSADRTSKKRKGTPTPK